MSEPESTYKIQSESPMKRYFLVSYVYDNIFGNIEFWTAGKFPSLKTIDGYIKNDKAIILNIFEFKSEKDYNEFIAE
jgi:hypothetical protein